LPIDRAIDQAESHGYQVREVSPRSGLTFLTTDGRPFRITLWEMKGERSSDPSGGEARRRCPLPATSGHAAIRAVML
jgi:hypothetical protein